MFEFGLLAMSTSDEFCRFAADCVKLARTAEDETHRTVFLQMARVWVALAEKEETSADRNRGEENWIT
jgi:predicted DNA-binding ArsR family transcriptional regulator